MVCGESMKTLGDKVNITGIGMTQRDWQTSYV